jgi:hypothetical protein
MVDEPSWASPSKCFGYRFDERIAATIVQFDLFTSEDE